MHSKVEIAVSGERLRIAEILSSADKEIQVVYKQIAAFGKQKRGLMQKLLTGEVQVKA